ncbi:MAG: hypothetical protein ABIR33_04325 [Pyrinomonadaceae bacterium]
MAVLEGKSPAERNKLIAAIVLGVLALAALFLAFGPRFGSTSTNVSVTVSPTPRAGSSPKRDLGPVKMPSKAEQDLAYMVPVVYNRQLFYAPDPGRNIFAFYEPPRPCPECPPPATPIPPPATPPPPTPQLPFELTLTTPANIYAGSKAFRLEVIGDRFTPEARIYFNNVELTTTFVNAQKLAANVPANLIATQSAANIMVRTPDGKGYSLGRGFSVQPPPQPQFRYVGMIARRLGNNDTAYLEEQGKQTPTGYRLNDVVAGRFRILNISSERVVVEDTNLGFRHQIELYRPAPGTATTTTTSPGGFPTRPGGFPNNPQMPMQGIPGIPGNIPQYRPPNRNANTNSRPVDDEDDEDTDNR